MSFWASHLTAILLVMTRVQILMGLDDHNETENKRAWACYGNHHNFLDVSCPPDRQVELLSMMNGAKPTIQNCPFMTTVEDNFRQDCCTFSEGDCVIETHRNNFPVECLDRHFCRPQSRLADTGPKCNSNHFPTFTHYTEITYRCVVPPPPPTSKSTAMVSLKTLTSPNKVAAIWPPGDHLQYLYHPHYPHPPQRHHHSPPSPYHTQRLHVREVQEESYDYTQALIGGMIAGIVGLILTIFIFIFYWGRKKQVQISGKTQSSSNNSSVWDFLLDNSMSVRAFRGYDNFSSTLTSQRSGSSVEAASSLSSSFPFSSSSSSCLAAAGGRAGAVRSSGWGFSRSGDITHCVQSNLTSDDDLSVVTLERSSASYSSRAAGAAPAGPARVHVERPSPSAPSSGLVDVLINSL